MMDEKKQDRSKITDSRLLLLDETDNVLGVARPIGAGEAFPIDGHYVRLDRPAGIGFKVARQTIPAGQKVLKYGACIGLATQDIDVGQLVHVHNLKSNYLPNTVVAGTEGEGS